MIIEDQYCKMHPNVRDVLKKNCILKWVEKTLRNKGVFLCLLPLSVINKPLALHPDSRVTVEATQMA